MITLVGPSALSYNGLISYYNNRYTAATEHNVLDGFEVYDVRVVCLPDVTSNDDRIRGVVRIPLGEARIPTAERAIADYLQYDNRFDMGFLCEGIEEYYWSRGGNITELRAYVAERGLSERLEYYLSMCDL